MALNFPTNPTDGQTYEGYVYDATAGVWNSDPHQIASRFVTSATAPSSPSEGDGWFDTNTAKSYVYYDGVWVQLGALGTVDLNQIADVNVSSPANGESLVYDGTDWVNQNVTVEPTEIYDVSTTSVGKFALPSGTTAERPETPNAGDIRFNTDIGEPEWYSQESDGWVAFRSSPETTIEYVVIAGGGGGGSDGGGGGGAGGYRSSVTGEMSGGGAVAEVPLSLMLNNPYSVTIGAGGAGGVGDQGGNNTVSGSDSIFASITSTGGGRGGSWVQIPYDGGSGGGSGGARTAAGANGTVNQGFAGGAGGDSSNDSGGGGGGAGEAGANRSSANGGKGGDGVASDVTGVAVYRAAGGGGAKATTSGVPGQGGNGGGGAGGAGGSGSAGTSAVANTGSGGGGGVEDNGNGGSGASGIIILRYPQNFTISPSAGLVTSTSVFSGYRITQITAGVGTVTFS